MPTMPTGALNRRVVIQTQTTERDAANAQLNIWIDGASPLWANISPMYQALTQAPSEFVSQATYRITVRWSRQLALAVTNRIQWIDPSDSTVHIYEVKAIFPFDADRPNTFIVALAYEINGAQ
jgi:head-tail adaptor